MLTIRNKKEKLRKKISFATASKSIKYLEINLTKQAKDLYSDNYKTPMKKIRDDTDRWRDITCSWIIRINIVKKTILSKATQIKCNPDQITNVILKRTRAKVL